MLKKSTIIKEFVKRGWKLVKDYPEFMYLYREMGTVRIFGDWKNPRTGEETHLLRLHDARLSHHPNFHLDSYWHFANMKVLRKDLDTIEKVYRELCYEDYEHRAERREEEIKELHETIHRLFELLNEKGVVRGTECNCSRCSATREEE